jgi:hypothetical protein
MRGNIYAPLFSGGALNLRFSTKICGKIPFVLKMSVILLFCGKSRFLKFDNRQIDYAKKMVKKG